MVDMDHTTSEDECGISQACPILRMIAGIITNGFRLSRYSGAGDVAKQTAEQCVKP